MFKTFSDKDTNKSVLVNIDTIKYVRDSTLGTKIFFIDNSYILVKENYVDAVARLTEKSK